MQLTFLCPVHRDWVYYHPDEAMDRIEKAQRQGEILMQQQRWDRAVPFLGCAFETAEILLEFDDLCASTLVTRLTSLAILLACCFDKVGSSAHGQAILDQAERTLQREKVDSEEGSAKCSYLEQCILAVKSGRDFPADSRTTFIKPSAHMH